MGASGSVLSPILGLQQIDTETYPPHYNVRLDMDSKINSNRDIMDAYMGLMSGSCYTLFTMSGSVADQLGDGGGMGSEFSRTDRMIYEVMAWAATSGSGG